MNNIFIGIPAYNCSVEPETMLSIQRLKKPAETEINVQVISSYNIADGRNILVDNMLRGNYTHILFVDGDVVLPKNALVDLLSLNEYMAVGTYPKKQYSTIIGDLNNEPNKIISTVHYHLPENKEKYYPYIMNFDEIRACARHFGNEKIPIDGCGLGCALIKRELFEKLEKPYFFFAQEDNSDKKGEYCVGEDLYFCRKVIQEANVQMYLNANVLCGHIGKMTYSFPSLLEYLRTPNNFDEYFNNLETSIKDKHEYCVNAR